MNRALGIAVLTALFGCSGKATAGDPTRAAAPLATGQAEAVFAGGCFWCMEGPFDKVGGVLSTESGYTGGPEDGATYAEVSAGKTGHYEALRVVYDPTVVTYAALLEVFWNNIDPTQADGQFCDRGTQYRSGIFTSDPDEKSKAEASRSKAAATLNATVVTEILPSATFWLAEDYHQDFYLKNPTHYTRYRTGCGRDARLSELWGGSGH